MSKLHNQKTNWHFFKELVDQNIKVNISLKTTEELKKEIQNFTTMIQEAVWKTTPPPTQKVGKIECPLNVKEKIMENE